MPKVLNRKLNRKPLPLVGRGWGGGVFGSYFLLQRADKKNEKQQTPHPLSLPTRGGIGTEFICNRRGLNSRRGDARVCRGSDSRAPPRRSRRSRRAVPWSGAVGAW